MPLDPLKRVRLHIDWGGALQAAHRGRRGRDLATARRKVVVPYLEGLKTLLQYDLPATKPELPGIGRVFTYDGPANADLRRQLAQQREQIEAREKADFERQMIDYRDVLTSQISLLYSRRPLAGDELQRLATEVLADKAAVERLMSYVAQHIKERTSERGEDGE